MYVTVAQSLLITCPITRSRVNMPDQPCLGNDCMAWRWAVTDIIPAERLGYCGMGTIPVLKFGPTGGPVP